MANPEALDSPIEICDNQNCSECEGSHPEINEVIARNQKQLRRFYAGLIVSTITLIGGVGVMISPAAALVVSSLYGVYFCGINLSAARKVKGGLNRIQLQALKAEGANTHTRLGDHGQYL